MTYSKVNLTVYQQAQVDLTQQQTRRSWATDPDFTRRKVTFKGQKKETKHDDFDTDSEGRNEPSR